MSITNKRVSSSGISLLTVNYNTEERLRNAPAPPAKTWESIYDHAGVDTRQLYQLLKAQNNDQRQSSWLYSVAYNDGTNQQRLLRVIADNQRDDNMFTFSYWDHYVTTPDSTTRFYPSEAFSNRGICLNDLTDPQTIRLYALDTYALQPLQPWSGGDGQSMRNCRNTTDNRASDVRNYLYNQPVWQAFENPRDMWNAPILFFRMAVVYDRGSSDYSIITTDGRRLTRVNSFPRVGDDGWGRTVDDYKNFKLFTCGIYPMLESQYNTLDGKHFAVPNWRTIQNYGQ